MSKKNFNLNLSYTGVKEQISSSYNLLLTGMKYFFDFMKINSAKKFPWLEKLFLESISYESYFPNQVPKIVRLEIHVALNYDLNEFFYFTRCTKEKILGVWYTFYVNINFYFLSYSFIVEHYLGSK